MAKTWSLDDSEMHRILERMVTRLCLYRLDADLRAEVVQESLQRIAEHGSLKDGEFQVSSSFLWKTATYVRNDIERREQRQRRLEEQSRPDLSNSVSEDPSPDQEAEGHEIGEAIRRCLGHQGPDQRKAVGLRLLGYSIREIAHHLGCNRKVAENRVYRGLEKLRTCLESQGVTP